MTLDRASLARPFVLFLTVFFSLYRTRINRFVFSFLSCVGPLPAQRQGSARQRDGPWADRTIPFHGHGTSPHGRAVGGLLPGPPIRVDMTGDGREHFPIRGRKKKEKSQTSLDQCGSQENMRYELTRSKQCYRAIVGRENRADCGQQGRLAAKRAKSEREPEGGGQEKAVRAICVLCVTRTQPPVPRPPLVVDAPYSMITITYVHTGKTRRWRGGSSADRSNENWLARAGPPHLYRYFQQLRYVYVAPLRGLPVRYGVEGEKPASLRRSKLTKQDLGG